MATFTANETCARYVSGVRSGTLCRVFPRADDGRAGSRTFVAPVGGGGATASVQQSNEEEAT
jgi:hypothetical protein